MTTITKRRAVLYVRTSSRDGHVENQEPECRRLAEARGLDVVEVYREQESAVRQRPIFERVMHDAHAGRFEVLIIWRVDRLGRRMAGNINDVLALDRAGVEVVSVTEPWLDSGGPARNLLLGIFSWLAEEERRVLVERTRSGLARVRREEATAAGRERRRDAGKRAIGRPPASPILIRAAADLARAGTPIRAAARAKHVAESTVRRYLAAAG